MRFAVLGGDVLDSAVEHGDRDLGAGLWVIRERGLGSVAVPALGVGNGGLDWADVSPLVHGKLGGLTGVAVALCRPLLRLPERGV